MIFLRVEFVYIIFFCKISGKNIVQFFCLNKNNKIFYLFFLMKSF